MFIMDYVYGEANLTLDPYVFFTVGGAWQLAMLQGLTSSQISSGADLCNRDTGATWESTSGVTC